MDDLSEGLIVKLNMFFLWQSELENGTWSVLLPEPC